MELQVRVAVVTGGAVRIGREVSLALAREGARVCVHYGRSQSEAERTASEIRAAGGEAVTVQADLMEPEAAAEKIFSAAVSRWGFVDVLINSAAIFESGSLLATTSDTWDRHHRINLQTPVWLSREFARRLPPDRDGAMINIVDWRAVRPQPGHLAYTLSKAGLVCLTQILAQELAPRIRVNAIAPGAILPAPGVTPAEFDRLADQIPLRRTGNTSDIVRAAMYLLQSDFVTGEILHVTGGQQLATLGLPRTHGVRDSERQ